MGYLDKFIREDINKPGISYTDNANSSSSVLEELARRASRRYTSDEPLPELNSLGDLSKYENLGLSPGTELLKAQQEGKLDEVLADAQSNWAKAKNSLIQTVGDEIVLGTIKAFSDVADYTINLFNPDNDYTNPLSKMLGDWQKAIREDIAPVYADPNKDIFNGGLLDFGWYASNFPSIASSITLLIPGKLASSGIAKGFNYLNRLGSKGSNNTLTRRLVRNLTKANKVSDPSELTNTQRILNSRRSIDIANATAKTFTTAYVMRVAENYQEAAQTYEDSKNNAMNKFANMTDLQFAEWKNSHKDFVEENNLEDADRETIANKLANVSANRTFNIDKINFFSDFAQVWGLRDAGKIVKNVISKSILRDNRKAIQAIGKTSEEISNTIKEAGKFSRYGDYLKDLARGTGKTFLIESTEGLEEIVNYIAQQEGITYGKTILGDVKPSNIGDRLGTYFQSPELWESAFWGLAGGVVFQGLGSRYNLYKKNKQAEKNAEKNKENEKTKEKVENNFWFELDEKPEIAAAREAIGKQNQRLEDATNKLKQIEQDNINIYGKRDEITKELPKFEGSEDKIALDKEKAKASVIDEWLSDSVVDAVHAGTFDRLVEFLSSDEMKAHMTNIKQTNRETADAYIDGLVERAKQIKSMYEEQLDFMDNQATFSNIKNNNTESTIIPLQYIISAAKSNLDIMLANQKINEHISILENNAATLRSSEILEDAGLDNDINYEDAFSLGTLTSKYVSLEQQKKSLQNDNTISELEKLIKLDKIKHDQEIILRELETKTKIGSITSPSIGRVLYTLRAANTHTLNDKNELIPSTEAVQKTDKELLEEAGYNVDDIMANNASILADDYGQLLQDATKLYDLANQEIKDNDEELKKLRETSLALYDRYQDIAGLRVLKALNNANKIVNNNDFENYVDIMHNRLNEARKKALDENENKIIDIYNKYKETDKNIIRQIIANYIDGRRESATKLAKDNLDADSAQTLIDVLDLYNFTSDNNIVLARLLNQLLDGIDYIDAIKAAKGVEDENIKEETEEEPEIEEEPENEEKPKDEENNNKKLTRRQRRVARREAKKAKRMAQEEAIRKKKEAKDKAKEDKNKEKANKYVENLNNAATIEELDKIYNDAISEGIEEDLLLDVYINKAEEIEKRLANPNDDSEQADEPLPITEYVEELNKAIIESLNKIYDENVNAKSPVEESARVISEVTASYITPLIDSNAITEEQKQELLKVLETNAKRGMQQLNDFLNNMRKSKNNLEESASNVAFMSKIGIGENDILPDIFIAGIERFIENYINASILPIIDGKKVLDIREIVYVVKNSLPDTDVNVIDYLLRKLDTYLKSPNASGKYYIVNRKLLGNPVEFVNESKDDKAVKEETTKLRVNISDYITYYNDIESTSEEEGKKYFDILNAFKTGDTLDATVEENTIFFTKDGLVIGQVTKASYKDGIFTQGNAGFIEDITLDANGKPISKALDLYKDLFLSEESSQMEIKNLILRASEEGYTNDIINSFINSKWIDNIKEFESDRLVADGNNIEGYAKRMLEHLVKIYNYNMQNVSYKDKKTKEQAIVDNLNNYFSTLYFNYDALNRINKDSTFKISYISDGQVINVIPPSKLETDRASGDDNKILENHMKLPTAKEAIKDRQNSRIGYTQVTKGTTCIVSGKGSVENRGLGNNTANLTIFDRNNNPSFVNVDYLRYEDINHIQELQNILAGISLSLKNQINKAINGGAGISNIDEFNKLKELFSSIIVNNKSSDYISLFRAKTGINVFLNETQTSYGYPSIQLVFSDKRTKNIIQDIQLTFNPKKRKVSLRIVSKSANLQNRQNTAYFNNFKEIDTDDDASFAAKQIINAIFAESYTELSRDAINGDNTPTVNQSKGLIERRNGKIITHFGIEDKEYESYNDFIIDNNLLRVNLGSNSRTGNRTSRGSIQALNQVLYIDATSRISSPVEDIDEGTYTPEIPTGATNETVNLNVYNTFSKGVVSGAELFIAAYGQEAYNDFVNQAGDVGILEVILPRFIKYNPRLNYKKSGKVVGPEAATNTSTKDTFVKVQSKSDPNKRSNARIKSGQVIVGDVLMKKLSSFNGIERKRGIAILIHERLHELIATNPNYTKKQILDTLRPIYEEFVNGVDTLDKDSILYIKGNRLRKALNSAYGTARYSTDERLLEEFMVETITNSDMIEVMNAIKVSDAGTSTKETLFAKLMRFMAKWLLGVDINRGYLLEKELNALNNLIDDKSQKRDDILTETGTIKNTNTNKQKPVIKFILNKIDIKEDTINTEDDEELSAIGTIDSSLMSIDGHFSALPIEQQAQFKHLQASGAISYVCTI